uniref:Uncharacterized protein n=1 Tax=Meloidogyne floridensis TaxID=298350 RepID=A0A915NKZ5_9BILA
MLIHIVISLFFFNFVASMDDGFGQIHENERQSFQGFGNYSTGTQYAGFGYPHHKDYQYPPTPRFSNYEESVGSNGTGYESNASGSNVGAGNNLQTEIPEFEKQMISLIDSDEEEIAKKEFERTKSFKEGSSSSTLTEL